MDARRSIKKEVADLLLIYNWIIFPAHNFQELFRALRKLGKNSRRANSISENKWQVRPHREWFELYAVK